MHKPLLETHCELESTQFYWESFKFHPQNRPKGPKNLSWMKCLHGFLDGNLQIMFHDMHEFASSPPPRGRFSHAFE